MTDLKLGGTHESRDVIMMMTNRLLAISSLLDRFVLFGCSFYFFVPVSFRTLPGFIISTVSINCHHLVIYNFFVSTSPIPVGVIYIPTVIICSFQKALKKLHPPPCLTVYRDQNGEYTCSLFRKEHLYYEDHDSWCCRTVLNQ